jgi:hypothetical protein
MDAHEVNDLLLDLRVMETHCKNALASLETLKARLEQLDKELMSNK